MKKVLLLILAVLIMSLSLPAISLGAETVTIKPGENKALVDGESLVMPASPVIIKGNTLVPLRFVLEVLGADVFWEPSTKTVKIILDDIMATLVIGNARAMVNGEAKQMAVSPELKDYSITMVPLRFIMETFNWSVLYVSDNKEIRITKNKEKTYLPPTAKFSFNKNTVAMGETVLYFDESFDPDGTIRESYWTGNKRAFFQPGDYTVTFKVRDNDGLESDVYSETIHVTDETMLDELSYHLTYPVPGDIFGSTLVQTNDLPIVQPQSETLERALLISNCPESVTEEGILYTDKVKGQVRLRYHHHNGGENPLMFYVLAVNNDSKPVSVILEKGANAGPSPETLEVGKNAIIRYLNSSQQEKITIEPQGMFIINGGQKANYNDVVSGIYDLITDKEVQIYFVAVNPEVKIINQLKQLPVLEADNKHVRGTFSKADRLLQVELEEAGRIRLVDGETDDKIYGIDFTTGQLVVNRGNYGVMYTIEITHPDKTAFFFEARGGNFSGALTIDDETVSLPKWGMIRAGVDLVMLGARDDTDKTTFGFMPPGGSSLPVQIIIWPY